MANSTQTTQQRSCCIAYAMEDREATYCIECGKPLLRCMAHSECGGIVDEAGLCPVCVQPQLHITAGASLNAAVGGSVAVPLELVNDSKVNRPLLVKRLWIRESDEWREEHLGWEKLPPGASALAAVTARELDSHGKHDIEIMWEVATQWKTREEHFAFTSRVQIDIADSSADHSTNIHINAENQQGNVFEIRPHDRGSSDGGQKLDRLVMRVSRADRMERELGLRGIDGKTVLPRTARFVMKGFAADHLLAADRPIVSPDACLRFGRTYLRGDGGDGDVRLLMQGEDGSLDEEQSAYISRRHFEIFVENERLILRVLSENGLRVNGNAFGIDKLVRLADGDVIAPLVQDRETLEINVRFRRELEKIAAVELTRSPPWREVAS